MDIGKKGSIEVVQHSRFLRQRAIARRQKAFAYPQTRTTQQIIGAHKVEKIEEKHRTGFSRNTAGRPY